APQQVFLPLYNEESPRLTVLTAGRQGTCLQNGIDFIAFNLNFCKRSYRSALPDTVQHIHSLFLRLSFPLSVRSSSDSLWYSLGTRYAGRCLTAYVSSSSRLEVPE